MTTLHLWPQDVHGNLTKRWNWSLSASGLVGQHSTLGYNSTHMATDNARWNGVQFDDVKVHATTSYQEVAMREAALQEYEHKQAEAARDQQIIEGALILQERTQHQQVPEGWLGLYP